ncbi:MAG: neutral/alkaline non-lysosomal ceramidase N-terminal domain-containing protein [Sandaracinaceae bacterium]
MADAGFGRADLTVYEPRMAMLGWGLPDQRPERVGVELFARAMALRDDGRIRAVVVADLCFISSALRARVLDRLRRTGIRDADLMVLGTHTHSGPNGFHHALFYDLSGPGLSERVLAGLAAAIADAVEEAVARLEPARLSVGRDTVEPGIAFNRALEAHRRNPDARAEPVDRTLTVVCARTPGGVLLGALVCFPLHATSVHADHRQLHPDHKGLAAMALEARFSALEGSRFVALCVQGAAGDVTPNHRFDPRRGVTVGRFDDDFASARHVADAEVRAALRAFERTTPLSDSRHSALTRVDFERRPVSNLYAPPGARTSQARLGIGMALGTREGPGPLATLARLVNAARRDEGDPKRTLLTVGPVRTPSDQCRLLRRIDPRRLPVPHPAFQRVRALAERDALGELAWIPTVLPVQLWRLGDLALLALPNEPTTIAGRRLARAVTASWGLEHTLVIGYANAYSGYLTTPEEYAIQRYEGAYTLFGSHTLGAYLEAAVALTTSEDGVDEGPQTPLCTASQARARSL